MSALRSYVRKSRSADRKAWLLPLVPMSIGKTTDGTQYFKNRDGVIRRVGPPKLRKKARRVARQAQRALLAQALIDEQRLKAEATQ